MSYTLQNTWLGVMNSWDALFIYASVQNILGLLNEWIMLKKKVKN